MTVSVYPFIYYTAALIILGAVSLFTGKGSSLGKAFVPVALSVISIILLVYLLSIFGGLSSIKTIGLFNWNIPFGKVQFGLDALSALFMIPLLLLTAAASLYGWKYFGNHPQERSHWLFFTLLAAGMVLVLLSRNGVAFIYSWEIMSVSSFFLVINDKTNEKTLRAGLIYFVTTHLGAALLFILFFILSKAGGSFDFSSWSNLYLSPVKAGGVFILSLIAFGSKAGFFPFHVWLPLAHPAAPSHVSAFMSGIMIKMGIYGILRTLTFLGPYPHWWGILLIVLGAISGILGVLFAIGQHDIKKLLAFHSVENIGIILLGMGMGVLGVSYHSPMLAFLGFSGALLHVINHAMFKGLLFMGAGAVIRQTGTGEIDLLGGLIKKMPVTAFLFILGSAAIAGLPFLNGFISEIMIYLSSIFGSTQSGNYVLIFSSLFTGFSLALIGGLAAACFTKVIGIVFLGEPRKKLVPEPEEVPAPMLLGMIIPAFVSVFIGMGSYFVLPLLFQPVSLLTKTVNISGETLLMDTSKIVSIILFSIAGIGASGVLLQRLIARGNRKKTVKGETWGCGYTCPDVSMQYTSSSFAQPLTSYFSTALDLKKKEKTDSSFFPVKGWSFFSSTNDWILSRFYEPLFSSIVKVFTVFKHFQSGKTGSYVLYIALTIILLVIWKFYI